ncbi:AGAP009057-PA, partial [Anopheles gambiae str. PEST]
QARLLATELASLTNKPQLVANVCFAVDNPFPQQKSLKPTSNLLAQISKTLSCTPIQETALSIALLHSEQPEIVRFAEAHLKNCLTELIESYIDSDSGSNNVEGSLNDVSPEFLQQILSLISYGRHTALGLTDQTYERFRSQLCRDFPRDRVPLILAPLLYAESSEISAEILKLNTHSILQSSIMKTSWTNLVVEVGYSFTATFDDCRNHLLKVGGRDITPQDVAKIVSSMCLTHESLSESSINLPTPSAFWPQGSGDPSGQKGKDGNGGSSASEVTTWKPEVLVQALKEVVPALNWKEVCVALDHPEFLLKDRAGLSLLLTIVKMGMQASNMGQTFPVECLYQRWTNVEGQLSIISLILKNSDLYSFADHIYTSVSLDLLKTPPETDSKEVACWMSLHLVDVLLYIADHANLSEKVMKIFKVPGSLCPDVLFLALLQINPPMTTARQELFTNLVPIFLGNHPNAGTILHHAWNHSTFNVTLRPIILHAMSDWYMVGEGDQSRLSRILDVAQDLKALSNLLNIRTYMFIIDLACLAQLLPPMVDSLNSLTANIGGLSIGGPGGGNSAFSFNNIIATPPSPSRLLPSSSPFPMMPLPPGAAAAAQAGTLSRLQQTPNDKLGAAAAAGAAGIPTQALAPFTADAPLPVSKEVEDEANSYFQRIYNLPPHPTLSIDEVLDMLQRYKDSPNRHENDVYQCMLRNLFEEYKFFPQYPDKELQTTAQLFGGMVERNLVTTYVALGLALRCVLDALKKPEGTKMYYFGITALDRFKNKLHLYPKYCEYVHSIAHFSEFPAHLIEYIEYGSQGQEPPNKTLGPGPLPPSILQFMPSGAAGRGGPVGNPLYRSNSVTGTSNLTLAGVSTGNSGGTGGSSGGGQPPRVKSIANATNIDTLLVATQDREEKIIAPPDAIQDKTAFIFNNLSQINLQQKCEEIKEILQKDYYTWLAQYLVLKRASIEVNFHVLYSNFLDALKIPEINRLVTKETFRNIRVLLRSDKGIANFSDRSLLKNLGHWLGMMTLGRNKPILHLDIDVKSLLVEAYNKGQQELLYVVPFVAKVLESCAKSKVFKPPNPWTMSIMNVLAELHQEPDLKLNLKFEIEVLCKNLNIDVSDLKPAIYLKDPERAQNIEYQLSQPKPPKETPAAAVVVAAVLLPSGPSSSPANVAMDPALAATGPPEPRFHYSDINIANPSLNAQHIVYHPTVAILHTQTHLKVIVKSCLERTISEWISLIVDRSVKIASKTTEQIVRKDFALDSDETRMRRSAHNMARSLVAGMAMITCRDQMVQTIQNNIKVAFAAAVGSAQKEAIIEHAAQQLAMDNIELVTAFIQKTAIEKVAIEMDKILAEDFQLRKLARQEGRRYWDAAVLSYHAERMPERIKLNVGGVSPSQLAVYEEFSRNIPGFLPITERDAAQFAPKMAEMLPFVATPDEIGAIYDELASKMDTFIKTTRLVPILQLHTNNMEQLLECLIHAHRSLDNLTGCTLLNKAVEGLLEGLINIPDQIEHVKLYRDIHLRVMRLMQDHRLFGPMWTNKAITRYMLECREELRYNVEAVDLLITSNFVNMQQFDMMLVQLMDNGNNYVAVVFAMQLLQTFFIDERHNSAITENDLAGTIEMLHRLTAHPRAPEGLTHLIEMLRANHDPNSFLMDRAIVGPTSYIHAGVAQARVSSDIDDSPGFLERAEFLLKDWVTIALSPNTCRDPLKGFSVFVGKMNAHGILKGDEPLTRFFRFATQYCIDLTYRNMNEPNAKTKIFQFIDAYVRLIALLVKHSGESGSTNTKLNLLNKILGIIIGILLHDQEVHTTAFQQVGYHRIFAMLFLELTTHDPILENISISVITAFCHTFHILRPSAAPGFCYSWLELIAHRVFIGRVLAQIPQQKGWHMYSQLLIDLFKYLAPFLRNAELAKPVQHLYKGTLRVLLVLLHDFPEFLCDYHFAFCDVIPSNCIQMRNLILSPYPRNMRLPDPFTPNLKVDMLNDIGGSPRISINYASSIQPVSFKKDLDSYLKARAPVTFLSELRSNLQISNEVGSRYNIPLMNALVLYVGTQAIAHIRSKNLGPTMSTIIHSAHMDIFQNLAVDLDTEGRYLFLNAIANQLRYPNSHTHYFSCCILYLFAEANSEAIQEQITRVLLERLIVNRPHPWGLLITFIELIKNPIYKFWDHDFVHCAPEIERLFESVAKSCMVTSKSQQQIQNVEPDITECS